ncbi:hypothetical protein CP533_5471 [Ophiocordyceps camponoti-saundersi (nom. inval.)]|nr:hypothetical protein CP533_5471 [Ophiocordyceps camponoti-saundersi (nom. inval.)]
MLRSRTTTSNSNRSFSSKNNGKTKVSKSNSSFSKDGGGGNGGVSKKRHEHRSRRLAAVEMAVKSDDVASVSSGGPPTSAIVTLVVGAEQRLFAAHEAVLCSSPYFLSLLQGAYPPQQATKRVSLPDEQPDIFSSVLEFLYKGDYFPRLKHNKRRNSWELECASDEERTSVESTVYHRGVDGELLKDTVIYCAAVRYGLEELKRLALRKQGLQSGIQCSTILASARYAYANTPDNDSKLRAHYLALIIRSRATFKRSGTMQLEMYNGGTQLFFDLFVAMSNHIDDVSSA